MDALDAGAYAYVFEAEVPKTIKVVLWGPLMAKELGFGDWTYQDGGETGFVYHTSGRAIRLGLATATLIVVRRIGKAYLTAYLGGYPTDAPAEQRRLAAQSLATEAELFLTRLAKERVTFRPTRELALVEPALHEVTGARA
jgi:hypothetical protein